MNYALTLLAFIFTLGGISTAHEFHISKCMVEYKAERAEIQISMHLFIDDLETTLKSMGVDSLYIGTEKESAEANLYIHEYLSKTFIVGVNQKDMVEMNFIGKEITEDLSSIWCYLLIETDEPVQHLFVKNSVLLERFDDQKNMTTIIGPEKEKSSFMSMRGDDEKSISY